LNLDFKDVAQTVDPASYDDTKEYKFCKDWSINFALQNGMVIGSSMIVVAINVITCTIFEMIVVIEKKHTVNDETIG
jgi:hypothetical protein